MKLGFVSDSLGSFSFEEMLEHAARMDVSGVEINTCGWSTAPHFPLSGSAPIQNRCDGSGLAPTTGPTAGRSFSSEGVLYTHRLPWSSSAIHFAAAEALREAIYHVHAKDTFLNEPVQATTGLLENGSLMNIPARSWSYITLGFGHGEEWWRQFCYRLKMAGYDGWLSIEHEDVLLNSLEGLEKSVALLKGVMPAAAADYRPQAV